MLKSPSLPRVVNLLFLSILVGIVMYFGREILVLITFGALIAMLMIPLADKLEKHHISRIFSSLISVFIIIIVISGVFMLLYSQIISVIHDIPKIKSEFAELIAGMQKWINDQFGVAFGEHVGSLKDHASDAVGKSGGIIADIVTEAFTAIGKILLVLVFIFLFLFQREKYEYFVIMLHQNEKREEAKEVIEKITKISEQYLAGRLIAIFIIIILYIIGFLIIGLKNGVLLAAIAGLVAIIPYLGPLMGGLVPFFMAIINGSYNQAFEVVIIVLIVNAIDHYFIEPYVVGGSVNISPFFTIIVLILGGLFWGLAGIILFLPLLGIIKIICENVEGLQAYAFLIGDKDDFSPHEKISEIAKGWISEKRRSTRKR